MQGAKPDERSALTANTEGLMSVCNSFLQGEVAWSPGAGLNMCICCMKRVALDVRVHRKRHAAAAAEPASDI